jgi:hypothetical protein
MKTIDDLLPNDCRYIMSADGVRPRLYCCEPTLLNESWCAFHYEKCFQKRSPPQGKPRFPVFLPVEMKAVPDPGPQEDAVRKEYSDVLTP